VVTFTPRPLYPLVPTEGNQERLFIISTAAPRIEPVPPEYEGAALAYSLSPTVRLVVCPSTGINTSFSRAGLS